MNQWWIDPNTLRAARSLEELTDGLTPSFSNEVRLRSFMVEKPSQSSSDADRLGAVTKEQVISEWKRRVHALNTSPPVSDAVVRDTAKGMAKHFPQDLLWAGAEIMRDLAINLTAGDETQDTAKGEGK